MQIEYRKGDFIEADEAVILHGCNAQGVMGRGAALAVKERLPWAYDAYMAAYDEQARNTGQRRPQPLLQVGSVVWAIQTAQGHRPRIVGNLITQEYWHPDRATAGQNLSYAGLGQAFDEVLSFVSKTQDGTIHIPGITPVRRVGMVKIGSGLAGGDWTIIEKMIETLSEDVYQPVVYTID